MKAELIKQPTKTTLGELQEYIAECASVVRDKDPKSPANLWDRLLTESEGGNASRVLEFIPCSIEGNRAKHRIQKFGFYKYFKTQPFDRYLTNMRELLNWGWSVEDCLEVVDFTDYYTLKCETPYFIYGQLSTHTQVTTVSHSQRYADCDRGYWMPPEAEKHLVEDLFSANPQKEWDILVEMKSPFELRASMKRYGIKRKEVFDRGADMLQNRVFVLGGYMNNDNALPHFFRQRLDKHTQFETREFVEKMKNIIDRLSS